jgi:hypothetical protein
MPTGWLNICKKLKLLFSVKTEIWFVSETDFTNKSYCRISGYTLHYIIHPNSKVHGGIALIIRNGIWYYKTGKNQIKFLSAINVEIDWNGSITITNTISANISHLSIP